MTEIILTSSILILLLAALRRLLRGRIDPRVQYALWLLVAARLLIPGTLFTAPVSVMGAAEGLQTSIRETFPDPNAAPDTPPVNALGPVQPPEDAVVSYEIIDPESAFSVQKVFNWPDVIWKTGIAVVGGAMAASNLIFYLRLRKTRRRLTLPAAPWTGKLPMYEAEGLPSPCLFGLFRSAVYLNEAAMSTAHPEHVLAHEYAHYRHGDQLWSILRSICLVIHWYNPLVWWAAALCRRDCELACDASALRRLGEAERIDYGQTLLGMISKSRNPAALLHTATTMTAGKRAMTERIALIVKAPRTRKITLVLVALLACVLAACTFGGGEAKAPEGTEPSPGPAESTEPSPERGIPVAVTVSQSASSDLNDTSYITDPEEVARLWELYQSFEYEGSYDPAGTGGWPIGVSFHYGDSPDDGDVFFILDRTGIYKDGESLRLKDIDEIHAEFLRISEDPAYPFGPGPARDVLSVNARSIVEQVQQGTDVSEWLPLMNYMDWGVLAREAVDAGLGEGDGSDATTGIMATIDAYIARQGPSMTQAEYLYILSATAGLDGAPAESYSSLVYRMHAVNPSQFAYVLLYELPEEQKNTVLDFFRYEYRYEMSWEHEPFDGKQGPSREEAIAQLERELEKGVSASPEEMLLTVSGESFQFLPVNAYGIYATTYASSNPYVADVTDAGTVTARGEGEADITMHFEGAQGQHDLVCHVRCELSGGSEAAAASIRTYIQNDISPREWLPFLLRTSWADIAVPWTEDGWRDWIMDVQQAIYLYILDNGNSLTDVEFLTIMAATKGLDGAYAEGYASILYTLYNLDPKRFAVIALDDLSGEDQDTAVMLLRYGWSYDHAEDYDRPYQERQAAMLAQLEEDKKGGLSLRPDAVEFYNIGEVRSLHIVNDGDAAVRSCESSDPEIVAVRLREDGSFELQAAGPGEALVTVRCTIGGEEQELTCSVLCAW